MKVKEKDHGKVLTLKGDKDELKYELIEPLERC
jgi:hypothetical protein